MPTGSVFNNAPYRKIRGIFVSGRFVQGSVLVGLHLQIDLETLGNILLDT